MRAAVVRKSVIGGFPWTAQILTLAELLDKSCAGIYPAAMHATIVREVRFEAAHRLPNTPEGHKCRRLHGHSFRCEIHVSGVVNAHTGWICDYADITTAFAPLHATLDHHYLNEVEGLENPTSENIAHYIWINLIQSLPGLTAVIVHETCTSRCEYRGE